MHYKLELLRNIKRAITGYYAEADIVEAKHVLFEKCDALVIGPIKERRDGDSRSRVDAHVQDIISAMNKLDKANTMPTFAIPSNLLYSIPKSQPEELNNISVIDRLAQLENKWTKCQELLDKSLCQNINLQDRVDKLEQTCRPSYSSVVSVSTPPTIVPGPLHVNVARPVTQQPVQHQTVRKAPPDKDRRLPYVHDVRNHVESIPRDFLRPLDNPIHKTGSMDNVSDSGASGYQYQNQYQKKLDRQNTRSKRVIITGNRASEGVSTGFKGAPEPDRHLFVYRVDKSVSEDDISEYLTGKSVSFRSIDSISNPDAIFKSFKLTVAVSQYRQLFDGTLWPEGVKVRQYKLPYVQRYDEQ